MGGAGGVNMEQFEEYFERADLDHDGRIAEAEAVAFFQGSNLPQQVIDQIWMYADENQTGFLNRPAFFNALKLVTVAQTKGELTKDVVKAALYGPAYAKIPPPLIDLAAIHAPQPNLAAATPSLPSAKLDTFETLQSPLVKPSTGAQVPQGPSFQIPTAFTSSLSSSGVSASIGSSTPEQSQRSWPELTRDSAQKYANIFMEVDTDRDGKITGSQTRNLFLSWGLLPREVLRQVWDLSDQDKDGMLSLTEFCIALYLMERCLEGQGLPPTVPNSVMLGETLLFLEGPAIVHGSMRSSPTTDSIHSADESKSLQGSPVRETTHASQSEEFSENHFMGASDGGGETLRSFDEPSKGNLGNNDDMDIFFDSFSGFDSFSS